MAHDVFISHSSKDKAVADAVCARLEKDGIRCWIAPRDARSGSEPAQVVAEAVEGSKVFVLIFSRESSRSEDRFEEISRAAKQGVIPVVALRIDDEEQGAFAGGDPESVHWLDAVDAPMAKRIGELSGIVQLLLNKRSAPASARTAGAQGGMRRGSWLQGKRLGLTVAAAVLVVAAAVAIPLALVGSGSDGTSAAGDSAASSSTIVAGEASSVTTVSSGTASTAAASSGTASSGSQTLGANVPITFQLFPADNPWNTDISGYPVHEFSDEYIASIGTNGHLHPDFGTVYEGAPIGVPYAVVSGDQPKVSVSFEYDEESDPGPYPIPDDPPIEGGSDGDGDRHIIMVDADNMMLYELFYAFPDGDGWEAASGAIFDLTSNDLRPDTWTSADAAGLPILPGLVRYDEVAAGEITHALRFTVSNTQQAFIHPATHWASDSTDPDLPPMGLRLRLKADYDISGFSDNVQVILRALKKYGMLLADNGTNWYITGSPDSRWDDDELSDLADVPGSAFEAVYTGDPVTP